MEIELAATHEGGHAVMQWLVGCLPEGRRPGAQSEFWRSGSHGTPQGGLTPL
jgi:hypothetical protein